MASSSGKTPATFSVSSVPNKRETQFAMEMECSKGFFLLFEFRRAIVMPEGERERHNVSERERGLKSLKREP